MNILKIIKLSEKLYSTGTNTATDYTLVRKIVDELPIDWKRKDLRILDMSCGRGTFLLVVFMKLIENGHTPRAAMQMVYGVDNNKVQVLLAKRLFKLACGLEPKIYCEDSLAKVWDMKFDVVIGNPPYDKEGNGRAEKLWPKFVEKSFEVLKQDGYCSLVTPISWTAGSKNIRKGQTGVLHDIFHKYDVEYINLDCREYFTSVSVQTGYFIAKKAPNSGNTTITDITVDLRNFDIIPSDFKNFKAKINILDKVFSSQSFEIHSFTGAGSGKVRQTGEDDPTPTKTVKTYVRGGNLHTVFYAYFDRVLLPEVAPKRKVILPISGAEKWMPFVDDIGIPFCIGCYAVYLKDSDTYEGAISVFNSKLFKFLIENYRTSGFAQGAILRKLPHFDMSKSWTDAEIYAKFNFTDEQINLIENNIR